MHGLFEHVEGDYSCLFESGKNGRYSYIAYDPFLLLWSEKGTVNVARRKDFSVVKKNGAGGIIALSPQKALAAVLDEFTFKGDLPVPFYGGAAGFFSYDYGCGFNGVEQKVYDDLEIEDYRFNFYDKVIAFDHEENVYYLIATAETESAAKRKMEEIKRDLSAPPRLRRAGRTGEILSNTSETGYVEKVLKIKELLEAGETYQVNFSQRFRADCTVDGWEIYGRLSAVNPAPYACYMRFPDYTIVSASPELLLKKRGERIETRPIKGTVKRGKNGREDDKLKKELAGSEKDAAELAMIVDLERNDLGKVCETGTVKVDAHREMIKCSHVIHTESAVSGVILKNKDITDALEAVFPSGSITGCPKKRTMEIIDRFEDYKRGVYTGSAGFINFGGDGDFNIMIRTLLIKDGVAYFHAGGGIVADSDPKKEYKESMMKARAIFDVLKQ